MKVEINDTNYAYDTGNRLLVVDDVDLSKYNTNISRNYDLATSVGTVLSIEKVGSKLIADIEVTEKELNKNNFRMAISFDTVDNDITHIKKSILTDISYLDEPMKLVKRNNE